MYSLMKYFQLVFRCCGIFIEWIWLNVFYNSQFKLSNVVHTSPWFSECIHNKTGSRQLKNIEWGVSILNLRTKWAPNWKNFNFSKMNKTIIVKMISEHQANVIKSNGIFVALLFTVCRYTSSERIRKRGKVMMLLLYWPINVNYRVIVEQHCLILMVNVC